MADSVNPDQTAPIGAVCSGSMLFASILNSSVMLGNYLSRRLQQTTFSDAFFSWRFKGYRSLFALQMLHFFQKAKTCFLKTGSSFQFQVHT